jgi:MinD-like ATPase involved in chromosome partitioning or flagellar assembly
MAPIVSIHSFRGGTGKSNTTANISTLLAMQGLRVGVVDTDIGSPGIHVLFGLHEDEVVHSLNDYLWGKCEIQDAAFDMTERLDQNIEGQILLIPASINPSEITRVLREGYDVGLLNDGYQDLIENLDLDVLMIDTHPGINDETLLSIAISDVLAIIMRPDNQDWLGTSVTVDVARKLEVPHMVMIVNKVPEVLGLNKVKEQVENTFNCPVAATLPHSDEMMILASSGIFVLNYPNHPITQMLKEAVPKLLPQFGE